MKHFKKADGQAGRRFGRSLAV